MRAELACLNHCAVPFLSRAGAICAGIAIQKLRVELVYRSIHSGWAKNETEIHSGPPCTKDYASVSSESINFSQNCFSEIRA